MMSDISRGRTYEEIKKDAPNREMLRSGEQAVDTCLRADYNLRKDFNIPESFTMAA